MARRLRGIERCRLANCQRLDLKRNRCRALTCPDHFWDTYGICPSFTNDPAWENKVRQAVKDYRWKKEGKL